MYKKNIFFDLEFTGLHRDTTIISIGMIADDGRSFYAEFSDYDKNQVNDWIRDNVIANLKYKEPEPGQDNHYEAIRDHTNPVGEDLYGAYSLNMRGNTSEISKELKRWLNQFNDMVFWGDAPSWDWVLLCDLLGGTFNLPKNVFYLPFDLVTLLELAGVNPDINREAFAFSKEIPQDAEKHNALWDAMIIAECYSKALNIGAAQQRF